MDKCLHVLIIWLILKLYINILENAWLRKDLKHMSEEKYKCNFSKVFGFMQTNTEVKLIIADYIFG